MSRRLHFWLRIIGLAVILLLEFGPHAQNALPASPRRVVASGISVR